MARTIFYAWQSDSPNNTNRYFIKEALEKAVKALNAEGLDVELDHDTKGVTGTPPITDTILAKIDRASVVVCDLTLVGEVTPIEGEAASESPKRLSNPNVVFEMGWVGMPLLVGPF